MAKLCGEARTIKIQAPREITNLFVELGFDDEDVLAEIGGCVVIDTASSLIRGLLRSICEVHPSHRPNPKGSTGRRPSPSFSIGTDAASVDRPLQNRGLAPTFEGPSGPIFARAISAAPTFVARTLARPTLRIPI